MTPRRYPDGVEVRGGLELRAVGRQLVGHCAVWDSPTQIGSFTETIARGAFQASLAAGQDILALLDHDPTRLLGRTGSESLKLTEDAVGLAFQLDIPDTTLGRDTLALAMRGDLGGASIGFRVVDESWSRTRDQRQLKKLDLVEISIVAAWPAYATTSVQARSRSFLDPGRAARRRFLDLL